MPTKLPTKLLTADTAGKSAVQLPFVGSGSTPAPAPSCTITLEAPGVGSAFGASAMDISGQVASITASATPPQYSASGDTGLTIGSFSGRRALECINSSSGNWTWVARGLVNDPPSADAVWRWNPGAGNWTVVTGGTVQATVAGSATDKTAVVLNGSTGDVEFWKGGSLQYTASALYSGGTVVKSFTLTSGGSEGDSMSTEFVTASADYSRNFSNADDWCGN